MDFNVAFNMAKELFAKHNVTCPLEIDRGKVRMGCMHWKRDPITRLFVPKSISLSRYLIELNPEEEVRNTILHEIAHFLCPHGVHHGPMWVRVARSIGCTGKRTTSDNIKLTNGRFVGVCPSCGHKHYAYRAGKKISNGARYRCGMCRGGIFTFIDTQKVAPLRSELAPSYSPLVNVPF